MDFVDEILGIIILGFVLLVRAAFRFMMSGRIAQPSPIQTLFPPPERVEDNDLDDELDFTKAHY